MVLQTKTTRRRRPVMLLLIATTSLLLLLQLHGVDGQRFMRQGMSGSEDFGSEMKLDEADAGADMTREMFLLQNLNVQLHPFDVADDAFLLTDNSSSSDNIGPLCRHVRRYLSEPVVLKLQKRRGKAGLRAVGIATKSGTKLRALWRQAPPAAAAATPPPTSGTAARVLSDYTTTSYDDACRKRLFHVEFEVVLPSLKTKAKSKTRHQRQLQQVSVLYRVAMESGSMNPKAMVPRGLGTVSIRCKSTADDNDTTTTTTTIPAGRTLVGVVPMKPGLVDSAWAKGRAVFRRGRSCGII
jgi:hypothetical protein